MRQIGTHVEREAVARNPPRDANADRRELLIRHPGAGQPRHTLRVHAEFRDGGDHHLLEIANVAMDVAPVRPQIDDRITHQLAGAVVGHVAAAAGFEHLDAGRLKRCG